MFAVGYFLWFRIIPKQWRQTNSLRVDLDKKRAFLEAQMQALLAYVAAQAKKRPDEQKQPEASRIYALLWDEVHERPITAYGIGARTPDYEGTRALLKETVALELGKCVDLTRRSREPTVVVQGATDRGLRGLTWTPWASS